MKFRKIDVSDNNIFVLIKENLNNSVSFIVMFEIYQNNTLVEKIFSSEVFLFDDAPKEAIDRIVSGKEKVNEVFSDNQSMWVWKFNLSSFFYESINNLWWKDYQYRDRAITWIQHMINRIVTKMEIEISK